MKKVILLSAVVIAAGAAGYYRIVSRSQVANRQPLRVSPSGPATPAGQTLTVGEVTYSVTQKNLLDGAVTWDFEISLDTHSGSLDEDLAATVRLVDDQGKEYQALSWEGDPPGGHHRQGILKFAPVVPRPAAIELKFATAGESQIKKLRWDW